MFRRAILLCTLAAAAALAGCATTADRDRELRAEFGEAARNCGLPRHEVEIDRRARVIRVNFRQRSHVRLQAEANGGLDCLRHWAHERNYRLSIGPDEAAAEGACPHRATPKFETWDGTGVRGAYNFSIQNGSEADRAAMMAAAREAGFELLPVLVNLNGEDTIFMRGPVVLNSQAELDREFRSACALGRGRVVLSHARYNPASRDDGPTRVR